MFAPNIVITLYYICTYIYTEIIKHNVKYFKVFLLGEK